MPIFSHFQSITNNRPEKFDTCLKTETFIEAKWSNFNHTWPQKWNLTHCAVESLLNFSCVFSTCTCQVSNGFYPTPALSLCRVWINTHLTFLKKKRNGDELRILGLKNSFVQLLCQQFRWDHLHPPFYFLPFCPQKSEIETKGEVETQSGLVCLGLKTLHGTLFDLPDFCFKKHSERIFSQSQFRP